ncbi:beta-lactamase family protein [Lindgomyces ingoldianus]|uniref:Beta-lactamase family protein n=1 Tax=Lindgomyces ingoldianus TaxID=673940 RepID=A0ACB6QED4_9PLEO|nr:beta-lactamase family protein [Lindgomyces ingoldianus]KAF2465349.1 beta-lactamase family protein [Lindgomyces ingoldianus]
MPTRSPFDSTNVEQSHFEQLVTEAMDYWKVPGLAIGVVDKAHISSQGYGVAQFEKVSHAGFREQAEETVTPQTLFDIGSVSKSFTAAAMALLVDDPGLPDVEWRTPVSRLLSDFVLEDKAYTEQVSVEDILSHRSGLPGHDESCFGVSASTPDTPISIVRNLQNLPLNKPLRTDYQYCNILYTAASQLIEHLSHTDFATFVSSRIWLPLEMYRTFLNITSVPETERANIAQGYQYFAEDPFNFPIASKGNYDTVQTFNQPEGRGAGSVFSSVEDLSRWLCCLLRQTPPLSPSAHSELIKPRIMEGDENIPFRSPTFYALGLEVEYYQGFTIIKHGGLVSGNAALILYIPEQEWGIVILGNSEGAEQVHQEVSAYLVDELLGIPQEQRFDWRHHLTEEWIQDRKKQAVSAEELYPELLDRSRPGNIFSPPLASLAGMYTNPGYRMINLKYKQRYLEADCLDRSMGFKLYVTEHAFDYWFVAELEDAITKERSRMRCQFEIGEDGISARVGLNICEEMDDLIWFDRVI